MTSPQPPQGKDAAARPSRSTVAAFVIGLPLSAAVPESSGSLLLSVPAVVVDDDVSSDIPVLDSSALVAAEPSSPHAAKATTTTSHRERRLNQFARIRVRSFADAAAPSSSPVIRLPHREWRP